jgi:hypothetical protein
MPLASDYLSLRVSFRYFFSGVLGGDGAGGGGVGGDLNPSKGFKLICMPLAK